MTSSSALRGSSASLSRTLTSPTSPSGGSSAASAGTAIRNAAVAGSAAAAEATRRMSSAVSGSEPVSSRSSASCIQRAYASASPTSSGRSTTSHGIARQEDRFQDFVESAPRAVREAPISLPRV